MNDVTALMGKLKANVAYLQFDEPTEHRAIEFEPALAAHTLAGPVDAPAAQPEVAAPAAPAPRASLLSRYVPAAEPAADRKALQGSRLLADIFARLERAA